jgi:hypothetical protein
MKSLKDFGTFHGLILDTIPTRGDEKKLQELSQDCRPPYDDVSVRFSSARDRIVIRHTFAV